jgi:hypothetical protein
LKRELEGREWHWKNGRRHWHLIVEGRMLGVWPKGPVSDVGGYQVQNTKARLRRALRTDSR